MLPISHPRCSMSPMKYIIRLIDTCVSQSHGERSKSSSSQESHTFRRLILSVDLLMTNQRETAIVTLFGTRLVCLTRFEIATIEKPGPLTSLARSIAWHYVESLE